MRIRLLGRPVIQSDDGAAQTTRGHQAWAVLARLLTEQRPLSRRQLATELFAEADDPLGALRWCLAELRRGLGPNTLTGDPVAIDLPETCRIDIWEIEADDFDPLAAGEFLESIEPSASSDFATWLMIERERFRARLRDAARRRAISRLSSGDPVAAIDLAKACIRFDPFDESGHILLVKALTGAGMHGAAEAHVAATEAEFRAELGEAPSDALRSAARRSIAAPPLGVSAGAVIESQIAAGRARPVSIVSAVPPPRARRRATACCKRRRFWSSAQPWSTRHAALTTKGRSSCASPVKPRRKSAPT
ncbi:MAG TPA: BTAD domain-containing putative transcriptional regulator [Tabrizicola sp.]|nr:BTAD domain-containing putative transcriptional regulator [Tabrizicola sp.]